MTGSFFCFQMLNTYIYRVFTYFLRRFCRFRNYTYISSALHLKQASQFANISRWPFLCQAVSFC